MGKDISDSVEGVKFFTDEDDKLKKPKGYVRKVKSLPKKVIDSIRRRRYTSYQNV